MKVTFSDNLMSAQEFVVDIVPGACCSCSSGCVLL